MISERIRGLKQSDIRAMTEACRKFNGINMGQGLCQLPPPKEIVIAAQEALGKVEKNIYSPAQGIPQLLQAIGKKVAAVNGINVDWESEVVVTVGATGGFAATLMALFNPGDEIIMFEPFYGYHYNCALTAGVVPQIASMTDPYAPITGASLKAALTHKTKAVLICTPGNPSGKMVDASEIRELAQFCKTNDLLLITDEMYEYFRYEGRPHLSPAAHPDLKDRTITLMGLSKTFSITGWRMGYLLGPQQLVQKIRLVADLFYVCAPTPLQHGVTAGFDLPPTYFTNLQANFEVRRDQFCVALREGGFRPLVPQGAYYVLADISAFGFQSSKHFAMALLEKVGIAGVPGNSFYQSAEGEKYIRFNFAVSESELAQACQRLSRLDGKL